MNLLCFIVYVLRVYVFFWRSTTLTQDPFWLHLCVSSHSWNNQGGISVLQFRTWNGCPREKNPQFPYVFIFLCGGNLNFHILLPVGWWHQPQDPRMVCIYIYTSIYHKKDQINVGKCRQLFTIHGSYASWFGESYPVKLTFLMSDDSGYVYLVTSCDKKL